VEIFCAVCTHERRRTRKGATSVDAQGADISSIQLLITRPDPLQVCSLFGVKHSAATPPGACLAHRPIG
jgi:hypothetical protein